jgi:signal transduction histidine kinase
MSPESVSKLFIDFNTIEENASVNRNGVGLGLSICKQLIEQMAGSVRVESEIGEGTKFIISFRTTCKITENLLEDDRRSNDKKREFG